MATWSEDSSGALEEALHARSHWTWEPIPLGMKLRGYLPAWLKGEMVYEAVVRTGHFSSNHFLQAYLEDQATTAFIRGETEHYRRIVELITKIPGYRDFV